MVIAPANFDWQIFKVSVTLQAVCIQTTCLGNLFHDIAIFNTLVNLPVMCV